MNIGLIGRARVGKDTVGHWLCENRGYERVAFADPLKAAALRVDPVIGYSHIGGDIRVSHVLETIGWEGIKDRYPEGRRILQELGASIRGIDPEIWLRAGLARTDEVNRTTGRPAVITDVRYPNEAESLRRAGFHLIYIHRPDVPELDHESEGALGTEDADHVLINNGSVADLHRETWLVADRILRAESRRQENRSMSF
ncbi:hypothetical protein [Streptomyces sp. NPDC048603]|uniref:deoxynucleotide monophosphate kinase family protein n=1 Tax=Streptomyces sp. NPDC048603 TaxID=3365577 RepID=UPI003717C293